MRNKDKRNLHQLNAWQRKGGVHDDQNTLTDKKKLRKQAEQDIDDQLLDYEEDL